MAVQNDFLPFAVNPGANVIDQPTWAGLPARNTGFSAGYAYSAQVNKPIRQSAMMSSALGTICANNGFSAVDDGNVANLVTSLLNALNAITLADVKAAGITTYNNITPVRVTSPAVTSYTATFTGPHRITGWGGGAGGGYSGASSSAGGGGGPGGSDVLYINLTAGQVYPLGIGAAGTPGSPGVNPTVGGTTSFNGIPIASGGNPGANAGSTNQAGGGGSAGTGLLGRQYTGSPGYQGYNAGLIAGGQGGNAPHDGGSGGQTSLGTGNTGYSPGGGGSGGGGGGNGGAGAPGALLIEA